jgi:hypothetical protein
MTIAPNAALDGTLAVTVLTDLRACCSCGRRPRSVGTATAYLGASPASCRSPTSRASARRRRPFPWQVDGDYLGDVDRLTVAYRPTA